MKSNVRRGFTLPEVLVTVTVVAVLAAVVVPAVTQFAGKADSPSTKTDVQTIETAITSFTADVRKLPGSFLQLSTQIDRTTTNLSADGTGATFGTSDTGKWKGPYSGAAVTASGLFTTSGVSVELGPQMSNLLTTTGTPASASTGWLATTINKVAGTVPDCAAILAFDTAIDGAPGVAGTEGTTGRVRWQTTGGTCAAGAGNQTGTVNNPILRLVVAP